MIEVKDPNGKIHNIAIKKVERLESDGTFIVHGRENDYNVIMHIIIDPLGKIHKLPHNSMEYIKLMMPHIKRVDVTNSLLEQLNGKSVDTIEKEKPKKEMILYYDNQKKKMYITLTDASMLGYLNDLSPSYSHEIVNDGKENGLKYYELNDNQLRELTEKYIAKVMNFTPNNKDDVVEYMKSRISKLLLDIKYYLENEGKTDYQTKTLIREALTKNQMISMLPDSEYKEHLMRILYYDLMDVQSTCQGLNLSDSRARNYNEKIKSLNEILDYRSKDLDLSNVKELLRDIGNSLNECVRLDGIIEPRVWFLVEEFINNLVEKILTSDDTMFREQISNYNKNNLLYGQIMYELNNHLEGHIQEHR